MITCSNLSFGYDSHPLFESLNLSVQQGDCPFRSVGIGKTTLFRLLTGLLQPRCGHISLNGKSPPTAQDSFAYMTQQDLLLPWRTLWENLRLPFELGEKKEQDNDSIIDDILKKMGLFPFRFHLPAQLSGGMRQRASLAHALIQEKKILFLDEPFGPLDVSTREDIYALLQEERKRTQKTIFFITHDFRDALFLSDRILLLQKGNISHSWTSRPGLENEIRNAIKT